MNVPEFSLTVTETLLSRCYSLTAQRFHRGANTQQLLGGENFRKRFRKNHLHEEKEKGHSGTVSTMIFPYSLSIHLFKLASVFHLFVVSGEALRIRPDIITNATAGEQVLFPVQHPNTDQYDITFRLKTPVHLNILTWKSNNPEKLHVVHRLYQHRVGIYRGFVVLNDVQVNDTGEYEIYIDYYGPELKNRDQITFRMHVFEPVSQPVTVILGNCLCSPNITLSCSVSNGTNYFIHWQKVSLSGVLNETYDGTVLVIDCVTEEEQHVYRCVAANAISNATSHPVTVSQSNGANPKGKRNRLILVYLGMACLVPIIFCILLYIRWHKRNMK
ncbi:hepatic and glial cell adhesion molecule-like [Mustelus asterias]